MFHFGGQRNAVVRENGIGNVYTHVMKFSLMMKGDTKKGRSAGRDRGRSRGRWRTPDRLIRKSIVLAVHRPEILGGTQSIYTDPSSVVNTTFPRTPEHPLRAVLSMHMVLLALPMALDIHCRVTQ